MSLSAAVAGGAGLASMVPATLTVLPPGVGVIVFNYNPDEYSVTKTADWHHTPQPNASGGGTPQFQGTKAQNLSVKIVMDQFGVPPLPPSVTIGILEAAMQPTLVSQALNDPKPPTVMLQWGTNIIMAEAYITQVTVTYKRFLMGTAVLAEANVTLEQVPTVLPGTNPTSGALASRRTHTVVDGDTLASVAFAEYRDAGMWRAIAVANGIDDPMRLHSGTVLVVPDRSEAEGLT